MYLNKLEPSSIEEFLFLKEQLSKYYPVLEKLEWRPGEILPQIAELTGIPKNQFEKEILSISRDTVIKNQKMTLMLFRLGLDRSAEQLERLTGLPIKRFERQHMMKMWTAWLTASAIELIVHILVFAGLFFIFHPLVANLILLGYCIFVLLRTLEGKGAPIANRISRFTINLIGGGDKRWRV